MLHSILVILGGFALFAAMTLIGPRRQRGINALRFIPMWLALSIVNMVIGIFWAGYDWTTELLIFLPVFLIPAIAAIVVARLIKR